jgi:F-type H+-transporting ATPase subunit gamma
MKMVAASKLKRARDQADAAKPYAEKMASIVGSLAANAPQLSVGVASLLTGTGQDKTHLIIVATSDRGLCGGFNHSIIKSAKRKISKLQQDGKIVKLLCIGKRGYDSLKPLYSKEIIAHYSGIGSKGLKFEDANQVAQKILELFEKNGFDFCHIVYNSFQSVISQIVRAEQIIPLAIEDKGGASTNSYEYEPSEDEILNKLLPKNVSIQIYKALLDNNASEQGARMTAMDNATRNSGEIIKKLTLLYNRTRQAHITKELIEIISGAEAI